MDVDHLGELLCGRPINAPATDFLETADMLAGIFGLGERELFCRAGAPTDRAGTGGSQSSQWGLRQARPAYQFY